MLQILFKFFCLGLHSNNVARDAASRNWLLLLQNYTWSFCLGVFCIYMPQACLFLMMLRNIQEIQLLVSLHFHPLLLCQIQPSSSPGNQFLQSARYAQLTFNGTEIGAAHPLEISAQIFWGLARCTDLWCGLIGIGTNSHIDFIWAKLEQEPNSSGLMAILRVLVSHSPIRHISPSIWLFFLT